MAVRQIIFAYLRAKAPPPTKEAVLDLIRQHTAKQTGPRRGWQVKAASLVKKLHVDRGDVKVGEFVSRDRRFLMLPGLLPRYVVPDDLETSELKPYVAVPRPKAAPAKKVDEDEQQ